MLKKTKPKRVQHKRRFIKSKPIVEQYGNLLPVEELPEVAPKKTRVVPAVEHYGKWPVEHVIEKVRIAQPKPEHYGSFLSEELPEVEVVPHKTRVAKPEVSDDGQDLDNSLESDTDFLPEHKITRAEKNLPDIDKYGGQ